MTNWLSSAYHCCDENRPDEKEFARVYDGRYFSETQLLRTCSLHIHESAGVSAAACGLSAHYFLLFEVAIVLYGWKDGKLEICMLDYIGGLYSNGHLSRKGMFEPCSTRSAGHLP